MAQKFRFVNGCKTYYSQDSFIDIPQQLKKECLEDFGFKRIPSKNQVSKKPTHLSKAYPHDVLFLCISQRQKILEEFGFKRIPRKQKPSKRPRTITCHGDFSPKEPTHVGYRQFLKWKDLEPSDLTWDLYEYVSIKNGNMYEIDYDNSSEIWIMDYSPTYLDLIKRHGMYGQIEIRMAQLILEEALKHLLHALSHVNRVFGKRELKQTIATATHQYSLLQDQLDNDGNFDVYNLICSCLGICHHSQSFSDMDHTVAALTRQQGKLCAPWLIKLWSRTRATIIYASNSYTDLLSRRFEKEDYQLSLLALSFADSLPTSLNKNQPTSILPPPIQKSARKGPVITYNAPPQALLFNPPLQPFHLLLPTPIYKSQGKLTILYISYYGCHGTSSVDPLDGKTHYLIPVLPYRWSANRAGVG